VSLETIQPHWLFKDEVLDGLAASANVAQFVSFEPGDLKVRYSRLAGRRPNEQFEAAQEAVSLLMSRAVDHSVNVRSFHPEQPRAHEFVYGLTRVDEVVGILGRLASNGLYTICNETVDVHDGGVSGVTYSRVWEFSPDDTPRCVEKPGTLAVDEQMAKQILGRVYGLDRLVEYAPEMRVEFSLHPLRRGYRLEHVIIWEAEDLGIAEIEDSLSWPNNFSRLIGDKAFGLLVADVLGAHVPKTVVISRRLAPFSFGRGTGTGETWIRTCPATPVPGRFSSHKGWMDPFDLLQREDPERHEIVSVLAQDAVEALYSGALVIGSRGETLVEGVAGGGEEFMLGRASPQPLPEQVTAEVNRVSGFLGRRLGPVRLEWVFGEDHLWVVQLHQGGTETSGRTIYPGAAKHEVRFSADQGLDVLRELIASLRGTQSGIVVVGDIGVTSHIGDILRRARVPSRIEALSP
jgi:hypothetical protein